MDFPGMQALTTAGHLKPPLEIRWRTDTPVACGDLGLGLVINGRPPRARLRSAAPGAAGRSLGPPSPTVPPGSSSERYAGTTEDNGADASAIVAVEVDADCGLAMAERGWWRCVASATMRAVMMEDVADVVQREQLLLDPALRADPEAAARLLHPDFLEFGKSGRVWDRESVLVMMASDPGVSGRASDFAPTRLCDDVVLLTYRSADGTLRSSIWVRDGASEWLIRFHQATSSAR
jgi:hypothetical protein